MKIICGDCLAVLKTMPDESVQCCVTSPPYWGLRDYGVDGQLGLEKTPEEYVAKMVEVFREVRRVLRNDGTLWLNLGDSYCMTTKGSGGLNSTTIGGGAGQGTNAGSLHKDRKWQIPDGLKQKDLVGIPWRVAFALQSDGWYLRQDIIWHKPNPMPESVTDRCTKAHEYVFLLAKSQKYYYDAEAIKEKASVGCRDTDFMPVSNKDKSATAATAASMNGRTGRFLDTRNRRSVWTVSTKPFKGSHFATFPPDLIEPMIKAGCPIGGTVLDPFSGAGTTGMVSKSLGRDFVGIELNQDYVAMAEKRINATSFQDTLGI
jgi:DNA modification methylase